MGLSRELGLMCVPLCLGSHRLSRQDLEAREDAGYASLELPGDSTLSLPALDAETNDDLISPYASFSSTADRPTPLLSGWLDKLSPQGWGCWEWQGRGAWEAAWWWWRSGPKCSQLLGRPGMQLPPLTDLGPCLPQKLRLPEALCAVQWEESDVLWQR